MARSLWSGSISFGLVNIPIKLYTAVRDTTIHFHLLNKEGDCRLRRKLFCPETGKEYDFSETARGYEIAPEQYVIIQDEELESLKPEAGRSIDITDFVDLAQIDPIYYDRTYYVGPDERGVKSYRLLMEAMREAGKVGIAKFVMRAKEYLCAIRPGAEGILYLNTMYFADEVLSAKEAVKLPPLKEPPAKKEVAVARQLVEALASEWDPEKYRDDYRDRVKELLDKKAAGETVTVEEVREAEPTRVVNLMKALEASLAQAKKRGEGPGAAGANGAAAGDRGAGRGGAARKKTTTRRKRAS
ncbi:MAG TPA: Ku protein [Phycisphaerales bacterium]|nr:Ku protein [Phycisphaerales bacterium]